RQAAPPAMRTAFMRMVQFNNSVACMRFGAQREEPRAVWAIPTDLGCPSVNGPHQATRRDAKRRRRAPGRDSGLGRLNNGWRAHSVRQLKTMLALPKLSFKPPIDADSVAPLNAPAVHLGLLTKLNALAIGLIVATALGITAFLLSQQLQDEDKRLRAQGQTLVVMLRELAERGKIGRASCRE